MFLEKLWVAANFTRGSKSRRHKLESRNLELAKNKDELGILNFAIWVSEAKRKSRHKKSNKQVRLGKVVTIDYYGSFGWSGGMLPRKILKI